MNWNNNSNSSSSSSNRSCNKHTHTHNPININCETVTIHSSVWLLYVRHLYTMKIAFKSIDDDDLFIVHCRLIVSLSFFVIVSLSVCLSFYHFHLLSSHGGLSCLFMCVKLFFLFHLNIWTHIINKIKDAFKLVWY